jgi:hypothetical protein
MGEEFDKEVNRNLKREASAPSAQLLGCFSRKGRKGAKDAKGRKEKGFVSGRSV